jgi:hypothetical protein
MSNFFNQPSKFYPLDPNPQFNYPLDRQFSGFNNVSYVGDNLSKYDTRYTNISSENIYMNLNQPNPITNTQSIPMSYSDTRPISILPYKASSYAVCVISAYIPETSIHLFEWQDLITPTNGTPYDKYTISAEYWDGTGPLQSADAKLDFTPYYQTDLGGIQRVFDINQCLTSLNNGFSDLFDTMNIDSTICDPPKFYLNKENSIITIVCDTRMNPLGGANEYVQDPTEWEESNATSFIRIGWNYWVQQWFGTTFSGVVTNSSVNSSSSFILSIYNTSDPEQIITYPPATQTYYEMNQNTSSTDLFSTVEKVVIVSNIQTRPQYTSISAVGSLNNITPNSMQSLNILADFPITISSFNNGESSAPLVLAPLHHMWTDILTQDNLNIINYDIFVQRTDLTLNRLSLMPGQMCAVKLAFRLK